MWLHCGIAVPHHWYRSLTWYRISGYPRASMPVVRPPMAGVSAASNLFCSLSSSKASAGQINTSNRQETLTHRRIGKTGTLERGVRRQENDALCMCCTASWQAQRAKASQASRRACTKNAPVATRVENEQEADTMPHIAPNSRYNGNSYSDSSLWQGRGAAAQQV